MNYRNIDYFSYIIAFKDETCPTCGNAIGGKEFLVKNPWIKLGNSHDKILNFLREVLSLSKSLTEIRKSEILSLIDRIQTYIIQNYKVIEIFVPVEKNELFNSIKTKYRESLIIISSDL